MSGTRGRPDVSIVITTYNRPDLLAATLASCQAQRNAETLSIEIVVVDNHPSQNGREAVEASARQGPWPVRRVEEPTRNMSILRNRGFLEAAGRRVAIIDDDETADPDWLDELYKTAVRTGGHIVVGPRLARFQGGSPPPYDPSGALFERNLRLPDGARIVLTSPSGKPRYGLGTGNSMFDMRACFPGRAGMMRPEFGDAGGEDAELFVRLHRNGARIVWAAGARVTETVPIHRAEIPYRLLRTRREAQHYVSIYLDGARNRRIATCILIAKGLIQIALGGLLAACTLEFFSRRRVSGRLLIAHGLGKLSWRRPVGYIVESA